MPNSISDFMSQVNNHVGATGAVFMTSLNSDTTVKVYRAPSAVTAGLPLSQQPVLYPRVTYIAVEDKVVIGDGAGQAASPAAAFINGLN